MAMIILQPCKLSISAGQQERTGTSTILSPDEELISLDTLDPFELLQAIEASADGSISVAG